MLIPARLAATCQRSPERIAWLRRLPGILQDLQERWLLTVGPPFDTADVSCAWVAPATRSDGSAAVLKIGMPHMEAEHELEGLCFWDGDPTVRVLLADKPSGAMLLERCEPGTPLRVLPEAEQDVVIAGLLRRLWRPMSTPELFRHLSVLTQAWNLETLGAADRWTDTGLVRAGLELFQQLSRPSPGDLPLATDLHAGNVLQSRREPWLVIDPKPFIGDPAYDATQHLFNCEERLLRDPHGTISRFADLLDIDRERVRLWLFARAAADPREDWTDDSLTAIARAISP